MRVLVCGGRDYGIYAEMADFLENFDRLRGITVVIEGGAAGADRMARRWATQNVKPLIEMPASWAQMGKAAGAIRNRWMLDLAKPDVVIAFPGGRGTANMIEIASLAGVEVVLAYEPEGTLL